MRHFSLIGEVRARSGGYVAFGCWLLLVCSSGGAAGRIAGAGAVASTPRALGTRGVGGAGGSGGAGRVSATGGASGNEGGGGAGQKGSRGGSAARIDRVFVIMEENHPWSSFASLPFVSSILPVAARAANYTSPGTHPSLLNYLDLEAGSPVGVRDDADPNSHQILTPAHLSNLLERAGISWTSWQESIADGLCPLTSNGQYAAKHNAFVYFADSTGNLNVHDPYCVAHNRSLDITTAAGDFAIALGNDTIAKYNFITPNLCNDAHDCDPSVADAWLGKIVPMISSSHTCTRHTCAIFIIADESGEGWGDAPVICLALSPNAKAGYVNQVHYTHYSLLRTVEEIFGVTPLLGNAATSPNMGDLFRTFP